MVNTITRLIDLPQRATLTPRDPFTVKDHTGGTGLPGGHGRAPRSLYNTICDLERHADDWDSPEHLAAAVTRYHTITSRLDDLTRNTDDDTAPTCADLMARDWRNRWDRWVTRKTHAELDLRNSPEARHIERDATNELRAAVGECLEAVTRWVDANADNAYRLACRNKPEEAETLSLWVNAHRTVMRETTKRNEPQLLNALCGITGDAYQFRLSDYAACYDVSDPEPAIRARDAVYDLLPPGEEGPSGIYLMATAGARWAPARDVSEHLRRTAALLSNPNIDKIHKTVPGLPAALEAYDRQQREEAATHSRHLARRNLETAKAAYDDQRRQEFGL